MLPAPHFHLRQLLVLTAVAGLGLFGLQLGRIDSQTGAMIALYFVAVLLASAFLRIPRAVWMGMTLGYVSAIIAYWWQDIYNTVVPADRLFEFAVRAIWLSVLGGAAGAGVAGLQARGEDLRIIS